MFDFRHLSVSSLIFRLLAIKIPRNTTAFTVLRKAAEINRYGEHMQYMEYLTKLIIAEIMRMRQFL